MTTLTSCAYSVVCRLCALRYLQQWVSSTLRPLQGVRKLCAGCALYATSNCAPIVRRAYSLQPVSYVLRCCQICETACRPSSSCVLAKCSSGSRATAAGTANCPPSPPRSRAQRVATQMCKVSKLWQDAAPQLCEVTARASWDAWLHGMSHSEKGCTWSGCSSSIKRGEHVTVDGVHEKGVSMSRLTFFNQKG